jgi:TolB-like protein/Flp pilus assembly protein TadD
LVASTIFYFTTRESATGEQQGSTSVGKSIAVLPFENLSNLDDDVIFTKGIHRDLLTQLSGIGDIKTIQRGSVMAYQDTTKNMKTIGEELGVATILDGGVQRSGSNVRINMQLIEAATDEQLWSESYTRELTAENVFRIQSEVSMAIAKALQAELSPEEQERMETLPTQNLDALEAYYRGYVSWEIYSASNLEEAVEHFEEAISLDPAFAKAHALLGRTLILQNVYAGLPLGLQIAKAEPHIQRALELDDACSEAYVALGYKRRRQGDLEGSKLAYERAFDLNPNDGETYDTYSFFLNNYLGDASEGARMARKAYDLDPKNRRAPNRLANSYEWSGQLDEAQELRESTAVMDPEDVRAQRNLGDFYFNYLGRFDDAIVAYRKSYFLDPNGTQAPSSIFSSFVALGDRGKIDWWGERCLSLQQIPGRRAFTKTRMLKIEGDDAATEELALEILKENPKHGMSLGHLTDLDIASGHPEKSRSRWELAYPSLFEPSVKIIGTWITAIEVNDVWKANNLARVLMATGEREQADYLITEALTAARSMDPGLNTRLLEAMLHATAGDEQQALAAIRRFFDAGGSPYQLMFEDELKPFQDHPEYQEMAAKAEARMAAQLKRIREMEANGELAPIPELPAD